MFQLNSIIQLGAVSFYQTAFLRKLMKYLCMCFVCWYSLHSIATERMVNPQSPDAQDAGAGSAAAPYKTLAYAMLQLKPGDHLLIAAGTYRDALIFPQKPWSRIDTATMQKANVNSDYLLKANETIIEGLGKVLIKGSDIVDDWRALGGGRYSKPWPNETQQVFVDGQLLTQIGGTVFDGFPEKPNHPLLALHKTQKGIWPGRIAGNQNTMTANSFYYDKAAKMLYIRFVPLDPKSPDSKQSDLNKHQVEVSTRPTLLTGNGVTDITIKNIDFQHANASTMQRSGLILMTGIRITLENLNVNQADGVGISLIGTDITLRNSSANNCGQLGINARGKHIKLLDNETSGNNTRGFNKWWEAGGAKFIGNGGLQDSLVSGHKALNNFGDGIWFDWKNRNNTLQNSFAAYNKGFGIQYEASDRGRIINNIVIGNMQRGIYLPHSSDSVVAYNLVASNSLQGIVIVDEGRRDTEGIFDMSARGNKVFSNVIAWNAGALVLPSNIADNASDGNVFIGDAEQSKQGQGWVNMFQEELRKWTKRTDQDRHSLHIKNTIDPALNQSIIERSPSPDLTWYQAFHRKLKPLPINQEWLLLTPDVTDLRAGPALTNTTSLANLKPLQK